MIELKIDSQPDDETCGPTCLHAIYRYYQDYEPMQQIIDRVTRSISGGTLAPFLGTHACKKGFEVFIYTNNLDVFDPTWFHHGKADSDTLMEKLQLQLQYKKEGAIEQSTLAYQDFLRNGGQIRYRTINVALLKHYFNQGIPILTGLSATYLYKSARELYTDGQAVYDDIRGTPCGHFVVLCGYDDAKRHIVVADPHRENPLSHNNYYRVSSNHLINSIMLGVYTYDANLIIILPKDKQCKPYS